MVGIAKNLYDPKYGNPANADDFTKEHAEYIEDLIYTMSKKRGTLHEYKIIGTVPIKYRTEIKLYWFIGSQPARALKALMTDAGIEYKDVHLNPSKGDTRKPEILAINPAGTIPFITVNGKFLNESVAIMRLIARRHPELADKFYPKASPMLRYKIDRWCDFYTDSFRPAFVK